MEEHDQTYLPDGQALEEQPAPALVTERVRRFARPFIRQLFALLIFGLLCVASHFAFSRFVITPVIIQGRSMMPALLDGEYYFLNRLAYFFKSPARGDLVVIRDPGHDDLPSSESSQSPATG